LLARISTRDLGSLPSLQMPPLDSTLVDAQDVQLVSGWIMSLPPDGAPAVPGFNVSALSGTNLILNGTNGWPGQLYYLLASTNIALPRSQWIPIATNPFDPSGNFIFTNPANPSTPAFFYLLQLQ
jgi:hypothetical protein